MDFETILLVCVLLAALVIALIAGAAWLDAYQRTHIDMQQVAHVARVRALQRNCMPDGAAISSLDELRMAIVLYDTLLKRGDFHGRPIDKHVVQADAASFVRDFGDADRGAFLLEQCLGRDARDHLEGYNVLYSAFVEAVTYAP